jgi:hypothetical protein
MGPRVNGHIVEGHIEIRHKDRIVLAYGVILRSQIISFTVLYTILHEVSDGRYHFLGFQGKICLGGLKNKAIVFVVLGKAEIKRILNNAIEILAASQDKDKTKQA